MDEKKLDSGLGELRDRIGNLEKGLAENTATTKRIESDVAEVVDLFRLSKGGFAVLGAMGSALKWILAVGASIGAIWVAVKGGIKS